MGTWACLGEFTSNFIHQDESKSQVTFQDSSSNESSPKNAKEEKKEQDEEVEEVRGKKKQQQPLRIQKKEKKLNQKSP